ncbi:hypothetical protein F6Y05_01870 (plasmid) [Bacillus megaterium]|nr:hypothetical protein [Priestia megaterium]
MSNVAQPYNGIIEDIACAKIVIQGKKRLIPFVLNFYTGMHDYQKQV